MAGSSASFHESVDKLSAATQDMHRAIVSLQEELEAVDWYQQRADACGDEELKAILLHNMREEIEHASMILEWLRRHHPSFAQHLRTYLFTSQTIVDIEEVDTGKAAATAAKADTSTPPRPGLTVGTMKGD
jgi:ferritin-like protein